MTKTDNSLFRIALWSAFGVGVGLGVPGSNASSSLTERFSVAAETDFNAEPGASSVEGAISAGVWGENSENGKTLTLASEVAPLDLSPLPTGEEKAAEPIPHFPNRTAAFVWRNWNLATLEAMARTLETTPEKVAQIAELLGLPPYKEPTWEPDRVYITLTRRNWSLLPYEQMLTLLDLEPAEFAEKLREDDFLWVKLGRLKPVCETLRFEEPTEADAVAMRKIAAVVRETLGDELDAPETPRFAFLDELGTVDGGERGDKEETVSGEETVNREEAAKDGEFNLDAPASRNDKTSRKTGRNLRFVICTRISRFSATRFCKTTRNSARTACSKS